MERNLSLVPAGPLMTQPAAEVTKALGAPPEEQARIMALMTKPDEVRITPIKIVYDARFGLGIFVSGSLLNFAAEMGPFFNGPDLPSLRITNLEGFVRAVGKALLRPGPDETMSIGRCIDEAILGAVAHAQATGNSEYLTCNPATLPAANDSDIPATTTNSDSSPAPAADASPSGA